MGDGIRLQKTTGHRTEDHAGLPRRCQCPIRMFKTSFLRSGIFCLLQLRFVTPPTGLQFKRQITAKTVTLKKDRIGLDGRPLTTIEALAIPATTLLLFCT